MRKSKLTAQQEFCCVSTRKRIENGDGNSDIVHSRDGDDDFGLEKNVGSSVPDTSLREGVKSWAGGPSNRPK
jgi:hypothetical protein